MGIVALSKSAVERIESREKIPSVYCDLRKHRKRYLKSQQTPNTPAISLFRSMRKAFEIIDQEGGMPAWHEKHNSISSHVRSRITSLGLKLIPEPGYESPALTAFYCENADSIKKMMLQERDITVVGCKGELKGKGLRIAHMGQFRKEDIDICIDALEEHIKRGN